jgi:hypothetical protein
MNSDTSFITDGPTNPGLAMPTALHISLHTVTNNLFLYFFNQSLYGKMYEHTCILSRV